MNSLLVKTIFLLSVMSHIVSSGDFFRKIYGNDEDADRSKSILQQEMFKCSAKKLCNYVVKFSNGKFELFSGNVLANFDGMESVWRKVPKPESKPESQPEAPKRKKPVCISVVRPLGMESGSIPNDKITASSYQDDFPIYQARLNFADSWIASGLNDTEWLQVDLSKNMLLYSVAMQGNPVEDMWVRTYEVLYSTDGKHFTRVKDSSGSVKTFRGNSDRSFIMETYLPSPVVARYVRVNPKSYETKIALRIELYGCDI